MTEPFNAREIGIVKKKINLLRNPSFAQPVYFQLRSRPAFRPVRAAGNSESRCAGYIFYLPESSSESRHSLLSSSSLLSPTGWVLSTVTQGPFSVGWKNRFTASPFFEIFVLKRLSRASRRPLPPSRVTLKAHLQSVVKSLRPGISGVRNRPANRLGLSLDSQLKKKELRIISRIGYQWPDRPFGTHEPYNVMQREKRRLRREP
jgi:hypothetical protein